MRLQLGTVENEAGSNTRIHSQHSQSASLAPPQGRDISGEEVKWYKQLRERCIPHGRGLANWSDGACDIQAGARLCLCAFSKPDAF